MHHSLKKRPKISHKTRGALLQELAQTTSKSGSGCDVILKLSEIKCTGWASDLSRGNLVGDLITVTVPVRSEIGGLCWGEGYDTLDDILSHSEFLLDPP